MKKCAAFGCTNEVVRTLVHKGKQKCQINLCAFHVRRILKYLTDKQTRELVLTTEITDKYWRDK